MKKIVLLVLSILFASTSAKAMDFTLHGAIKNESAYFIAGQREWDKIQNRLELKPELHAGDWEFRSRFLMWYDPASGSTSHSATQVKEAYLTYAADDFDLRLGQQQVVWGKTDGLRMLDVINPLDMREFILDDFLDSRIGLVAARLNYYPDTDIEQEFEFLIVPDARPMRMAAIGSRWRFATPALPAGVQLNPLAPQQPNWSAKNTEAGLAWRGNINGWDLSANYFYGWNDIPNIFRRFVAPNTIIIQSKHLRMHILGGSVSNAFGSFVLRAEFAANLGEGINADGFTFTGTVQRKNTFNGAVAAEWSKHNWNISTQLFFRHIQGWTARLWEVENAGFWTLRLATDFMHEKLKTELLFLADWSTGSWLSRPKISYEWGDQFTTTLGSDVFGGKRGLLGQFNSNDRVYMEAEFTF